MRISRLLVITVSSLGLVTLPAAPYAAAADSTVVVQDLGQLPTDGSYGITYQSCLTPGQVVATAPAPDIRKGPGSVPLGLRTWGFHPAGTKDAIGPYRAIDSMGSVSVDSVMAYADKHSTGVALAEVIEDDTTKRWYGVSDTPISIPAGSWTTVSGLDATYQWLEVTVADGQPTGNTLVGTRDDLLAHNATGDQPGYVGIAFGCNGKGPVHLDDAQFGGPNDVATYDFEGPTTTTTVHASHGKTTAGKRVTITGVTTARDGSPLLSARLTLQERLFGATSWKTVGHATETFNRKQRPARLRVEPQLRTTYRWVYPTGQAASGSISGGVLVQVHTGVTVHAAHPSVAAGGTIVVSGKVTPNRAGRVVTLFRGSHKLGIAKVDKHGRYQISALAKAKGVWKLHVTIPPGAGDLAGSSPVVKVRVG